MKRVWVEVRDVLWVMAVIGFLLTMMVLAGSGPNLGY